MGAQAAAQRQQPGAQQNPALQLQHGVSSPGNFEKGCWRRGESGHNRQSCPKYAAEVNRVRAQARGGSGVRELGADGLAQADA
eukprot:2150664-Alexandrium_andersonii.AAC.1